MGLLAGVASAQTPPASTDQRPGAGLQRLSIEELSRISVISASRQAETINDAAAAVSILTGDAIRRAGVTTLADALRLVTGVAVGRDGQTWAISARGFQASATNKMVVLVDGRSVYSPLFSGVFWDAVDLVLADVDRIEVIRGPGGSLWGANAVNGVINIVTKLTSRTQGGLVEATAGTSLGMLVARYGGSFGADRHFRVYTKYRHLQSMPYEDGSDPDEDLRGIQTGVRVDIGAETRTSFMLRADAYSNRFGLLNSEDGEASGASVLVRARRTLASGGQLQAQAYYDTTFRRVPVQYAERRHTVDGELQYAFSGGRRHHLVTGVGVMLTHDDVTPTVTFSFDPLSRTAPLVNVFAQDDITIVAGRLSAIAGVKLEHNDFTGFEYQPTVRLRWTPSPRQMVWGAVSRAVRMPTRFDSDLRFTAGTAVVVIRGDRGFRSETVLAREIGYRTRLIPRTALSLAVFVNRYDDLRSQEPTPPLGIPIVVANKHHGRVAGAELAVQVEPAPWWHINAGYTRLAERFGFDADSRDATGGFLEHNDPAHQFRLRSFIDVAGRFALDATVRWVGALPRPAVPAYGELTLRVARPIRNSLELEVVGENLLHARHLEFVNLGRPHAVPRSVFARLTWRSR